MFCADIVNFRKKLAINARFICVVCCVYVGVCVGSFAWRGGHIVLIEIFFFFFTLGHSVSV